MKSETRILKHRRTIVLILWGLIVSLSACDDPTGPVPPEGSPPALSALSLDPSLVQFERLPDEQVLGDSLARVPIALEVRVEETGACAERVGYVIAAALDADGPRATGDLEPRGPWSPCATGWHETTAEVELPRGATGPYTVRIYAIDEYGRLGEQMQGMFHFVLQEGKPPVVEHVEASADTIRPPTELQFVATVSDPDGLSNVGRVLVEAPNGDEFRMNDQGLQGDAEAGDGRYTATFDVPEAEPGEEVFKFRAVDRNGLESNVVEKTIVVAE